MLKVLLSVGSFIPLFLEFYVFESKTALILFLVYSSLLLFLLNLAGRWYMLLVMPILILSALVSPYIFPRVRPRVPGPGLRTRLAERSYACR